jgi:hypothetical protein
MFNAFAGLKVEGPLLERIIEAAHGDMRQVLCSLILFGERSIKTHAQTGGRSSITWKCGH